MFLLAAVAVFFLISAAVKNAVSPLNSASTEKISVTTSFYPLADFTHQIGQDLVDVKNLTPAGAEPHDYEPTPQDLVRLQKSQLFVYNGAGLELWLEKLSADTKDHLLMVNASEGIQLIPAGDVSAESGDVLSFDPHIWMDPVRASQEVENISNGLQQADPQHAKIYQQHAQRYQQDLATLNAEFRAGVSNCKSSTIVTSHNAFRYLAERYGLTVLSLSGLSPDEEPSPQRLAEVVQFTKAHAVKYIFFESLVSPKLSETIAQETGAKTLSFNPLEGLTEQELAEGKNYLSVQRENLAALRTALECK